MEFKGLYASFREVADEQVIHRRSYYVYDSNGPALS
jgi:hypothetical protein